jgi:hypothetical protein
VRSRLDAGSTTCGDRDRIAREYRICRESGEGGRSGKGHQVEVISVAEVGLLPLLGGKCAWMPGTIIILIDCGETERKSHKFIQTGVRNGSKRDRGIPVLRLDSQEQPPIDSLQIQA